MVHRGLIPELVRAVRTGGVRRFLLHSLTRREDRYLEATH